MKTFLFMLQVGSKNCPKPPEDCEMWWSKKMFWQTSRICCLSWQIHQKNQRSKQQEDFGKNFWRKVTKKDDKSLTTIKCNKLAFFDNNNCRTLTVSCFGLISYFNIMYWFFNKTLEYDHEREVLWFYIYVTM